MLDGKISEKENQASFEKGDITPSQYIDKNSGSERISPDFTSGVSDISLEGLPNVDEKQQNDELFHDSLHVEGD